MASPIAISPISAAQILVSWIQTQGREPRVRECRPVNGLLNFLTFMDRLPGETFSACISAARMMVSAMAAPRMQVCMGSDCTARFPYQGYHFCSSCRAELGYDQDDTRNGRYLAAHEETDAARSEQLAFLSQATLRYYGLEEEEGTYRAMYNNDQVHGFDDSIATQMNHWQHASRKRRFFEGR